MGMFLSLPEQICDSKLKVFSFIQDPLNGQAKLLVIKTPIKKGKIPNKVYDSSGTDICYVLFFAH